MVTQKISIWGNSLGIRLPQTIIHQMGLKQGDLVAISTEDNKIVLSPARPRYTLNELLKDVIPDRQHDEVDWGEPMREESW
ncbi:AbrB/MazE/SpoVT family DNA-binding domain-containing protein [Aetokthonos hydrillicola Thurmond2011]|jgi:antitoxin MazE|uniref:AbrB/MazE/SpoVT family DNA-binding domain-containing protein n=1 Tax=Aetokthonos hydrillicola Thurmond2011 TaxID=2712845 RepID=A0AAP5I2M5_9CYAN|nr:AbrB/MazE/SpoVT family DNA-binding domain-containing protein [Aetokthonos hydrillicola CCALA 1050]MBW4586711.1 AbrB/MazE/SpoVT family DNA-binding domain-containing protein [Aetokthonos hydrillicola CCALA 1050]MDR9893962.1 AbrB/MazE/SpoVT family DNA-binding domain-containing protein [Aetokthonos hydrillicola Thurmond2011]